MVKPTTLLTPLIHKPLHTFLSRDPSFACGKVHWRGTSISGNHPSRSCFWSLRGGGGAWGRRTYPSSLVLRRFFRSSLVDLVIPFLADSHKRRKLSRHMTISEWMLHFLRQSHPQGNPQGRRIPIKIGSDNLELSMILRELTVLLLNLLHFPFGGGYSVKVPKSCFHELYKSW